MKKYWILLVIGIISLGFVSCGDDDDDGGASGTEADAGAVTDADGSKCYITSIGDLASFEYDSNWRLTGWTHEDYYNWSVTYDPLYMVGQYVDEDDEEEETIVFSNFSLNSSGYITKFSASQKYYDSYYDESYSSTATYNFTYNSSGQLTEITCSGSGKETYEGETYSESGSFTDTFTWSNGVITSYESTSSGSGTGYKYTDNETGTFDYGDNEYVNSTKQYVYHVGEVIFGDDCELAILGYLGIGTTYLPVALSIEEEGEETYDGEVETWSGSYTEDYSDEDEYGFNDNGTVSWEKWEGGTQYYTYSDGSSTRADVRDMNSIDSGSKAKVRTRGCMNFLRKAMQRHRARRIAQE